MANRRMLAKNISRSEKFADLKSDRARVLYQMQLPHTDDFGCFDASLRTYKATVCPLLNYSLNQIQEALEDMAQVGLIVLYEVNGHQYGQVSKFDTFQTFKKDRERKSEYPQPTDGESLESNGIQEIPNGTYKLSKDKLSKDKLSKDSAYSAEFLSFWENYPRKIEKKKAYKAWLARIKEGEPPEKLIAAAIGYSQYCTAKQIEETYIKHPATFLGPNQPYEDFVKTKEQDGKANSGLHPEQDSERSDERIPAPEPQRIKEILSIIKQREPP
ncbi:MAG: hypothetical protein DDT19_00058 [Syntrophomonadaceae bacterium]|nr:hypothetical protein [Bacillota bacterium]